VPAVAVRHCVVQAAGTAGAPPFVVVVAVVQAVSTAGGPLLPLCNCRCLCATPGLSRRALLLPFPVAPRRPCPVVAEPCSSLSRAGRSASTPPFHCCQGQRRYYTCWTALLIISVVEEVA
jgi:hypothetical protein